MSLYYEAASFLTDDDKIGGSLRSRIYNRKDLKSSPAQLFALVTEASKWSAVLKDVIEKSGMLQAERGISPVNALCLTHDLLLSKKGIAAPSNHVLRRIIDKHKTRLRAEFAKVRIKRGFGSVEAFRVAIEAGETGPDDDSTVQSTDTSGKHPRWIRINTLRTNLEEQLSSTFEGYEKARKLSDVLAAPRSSKILHLDSHIPNLIALPPKADLTKSMAYTKGHIIFQDKASCFPAYLLDISPKDGDVVDACAAPGNKTTHITAILSEREHNDKGMSRDQRVIAFEKDKKRAEILRKMIKTAGADGIVSVKGGQDFLGANPEGEEFSRVGALILDPSCSGSGIVGRDDKLTVYLPSAKVPGGKIPSNNRGKKRKLQHVVDTTPESPVGPPHDIEGLPAEEIAEEEPLAERLSALSAFQLQIVIHAMHFPAARKITYSTCSIHFEENERVVLCALMSAVARERGWKILKRDQQVEGLRKWKKRGIFELRKMHTNIGPAKEPQRSEILDACIRTEKATDEGTMGFFVAAFVRDAEPSPSRGSNAALENDAVEEEEEWQGFSDDEGESKHQEGRSMENSATMKSTGRGKKKRKTR